MRVWDSLGYAAGSGNQRMGVYCSVTALLSSQTVYLLQQLSVSFRLFLACLPGLVPSTLEQMRVSPQGFRLLRCSE